MAHLVLTIVEHRDGQIRKSSLEALALGKRLASEGGGTIVFPDEWLKKPGSVGRASYGELHIVDFGGQEHLPAWARHALRLWLARFDVVPRDGLASQLELSAARSGAELVVERPYRGYAQYAVMRTPSTEAVAIAPPAAA
jgi:hypothetical protein